MQPQALFCKNTHGSRTEVVILRRVLLAAAKLPAREACLDALDLASTAATGEELEKLAVSKAEKVQSQLANITCAQDEVAGRQRNQPCRGFLLRADGSAEGPVGAGGLRCAGCPQRGRGCEEDVPHRQALVFASGTCPGAGVVLPRRGAALD